MRYFGVGDTGGAPDAESLGWLERSLASGRDPGAPIEVRTGPAGRLFAELTAAEIARLPRYRGELLLSVHGTGCYTSQAAMKRWNRKNELLADAAERAAAAAHWLGAAAYPRARLGEAWRRVLAHQFHDDLPGTSVPEAYRHSWNDELLSLNEFAETLRGALAGVASGLDTRGEGIPVVVFNPLSVEREEVVEARLRIAGPAPRAVRVRGPEGEELVCQVAPRRGGRARGRFRRAPAGGGLRGLRCRAGGRGGGRRDRARGRREPARERALPRRLRPRREPREPLRQGAREGAPGGAAAARAPGRPLAGAFRPGRSATRT